MPTEYNNSHTTQMGKTWHCIVLYCFFREVISKTRASGFIRFPNAWKHKNHSACGLVVSNVFSRWKPDETLALGFKMAHAMTLWMERWVCVQMLRESEHQQHWRSWIQPSSLMLINTPTEFSPSSWVCERCCIWWYYSWKYLKHQAFNIDLRHVWFFDIYFDIHICIYIYILIHIFMPAMLLNLHRQFIFPFAKKSFELWTDLTRIRSNCLVSQYLGIERSSQS